MAGDEGVEPPQTGSQSPARYHYANPQNGTPNGVRTRASGVKGRRVNHFTMGAFSLSISIFIIYKN